MEEDISLETNENKVLQGEVVEEKKHENILKGFFHKHETFFSSVYGTAFVIGYLYGIIVLLKAIFDSLRSGDFISFVISIVFSSIIMMFTGLLVGIILGTILAIVLFIPYLVIRGLKN